MNHLRVRSAAVYDRSGKPGLVADAAVKDGRTVTPGPALQPVDAGGLAPTLGIADVPTRYDAGDLRSHAFAFDLAGYHRGDGELRHFAVQGRRKNVPFTERDRPERVAVRGSGEGR